MLKKGLLVAIITIGFSFQLCPAEEIFAQEDDIMTINDYDQQIAKQESIKKMKISELDPYIDELLDVEHATLNQSQNLMFAINTRLNQTYGQEMTESWSKTDTTIKDWLPRIKKSSHFDVLKKDSTILINDFLKTRKAEHFRDKIGNIALGFVVIALIPISIAVHRRRKKIKAKRKEENKHIRMI